MRNGGACIQKDDMEDILCAFQQADVVVLATPVYFYGVSAQMKACIDRTYPIGSTSAARKYTTSSPPA